MEPGTQFSGARQGVRYRGNDGRGSILMSGDGDPQPTLFDDHPDRHRGFGWGNPLQPVHAESVEYGHTVAERPHDPTQWNGQMPLPGMPKPTDPALHRLRQSNPALNDYQFRTVRAKNWSTDGRLGKPNTPHKVEAHDAAGNRVGYLKLGHEQYDFEQHTGHREVEEVGVAPNHAGKGLGEAMYDLARMKGAKIVHSSERSESGEAFARRVGGPRLTRTRGQGYDDYLGLNPRSDRV